jgi:membrane-associated phospholipid phosphatase
MTPIPNATPFDHIGYYGPIILLIVTIMLMIARTKVLTLYIIFFIINAYLNKAIKLLIREPRPFGNILFNHSENTEGSEQYGMPSGHAQSVAFTTMFLYLFTKPTDAYLTMGAVFIGAITLYQRYKYKRHSISQLLAGTTVGALVATLCNKIYTYKI